MIEQGELGEMIEMIEQGEMIEMGELGEQGEMNEQVKMIEMPGSLKYENLKLHLSSSIFTSESLCMHKRPSLLLLLLSPVATIKSRKLGRLSQHLNRRWRKNFFEKKNFGKIYRFSLTTTTATTNNKKRSELKKVGNKSIPDVVTLSIDRVWPGLQMGGTITLSSLGI